MKLTTFAFVMGLALTSLAVKAEDKAATEVPAKETKAQTVCPVMKGKINKKQFIDVKGKRIYVCCPPCKKKIKADPDTYIKVLEDMGVTIEEAPKPEEKK